MPCFATAHPAAAATMAAAVDTLIVWSPSPPVPHVSTASAREVWIRVAFSRMARALPVISATVSPFMRSAIAYAAIRARAPLRT